MPEHLVIIGGGYIGCEFAQMFRRFGSAVTILQRGGTLLGGEDPDMAGMLADVLSEDGVQIVCHAAITAVAPGQVELPGEHVREPAFGLPATWIEDSLREVRRDLPPEQWPKSRTYTIRSWDPVAGELAIDFVHHGDAGIAG